MNKWLLWFIPEILGLGSKFNPVYLFLMMENYGECTYAIIFFEYSFLINSCYNSILRQYVRCFACKIKGGRVLERECM
jgi:hypothetical protein